MALVSPGIEVSVTNDSFFIPAAAPTVPLIFLATADEKTQPNKTTTAEGTQEHSIVRTITSLNQSTQMYGVPRFIRNKTTGKEYHGDARNEYGLFALNQYLSLGNRAYVVRANVNLNDNIDDLRTLWDRKFNTAKTVVQNLIQNSINQSNTASGLNKQGQWKIKQGQTQDDYMTNYVNGGSGYKVGDEVPLNNGTIIVVKVVDDDGKILQFETRDNQHTQLLRGESAAGLTVKNGETLYHRPTNGREFSLTVRQSNMDKSHKYLGYVKNDSATNVNRDIAPQDQTDFEGGGSEIFFTAGTGYAKGDLIQLNNKAVVLVNAVSSTGAVTAFVLRNVGDPIEGYTKNPKANNRLTQADSSNSSQRTWYTSGEGFSVQIRSTTTKDNLYNGHQPSTSTRSTMPGNMVKGGQRVQDFQDRRFQPGINYDENDIITLGTSGATIKVYHVDNSGTGTTLSDTEKSTPNINKKDSILTFTVITAGSASETSLDTTGTDATKLSQESVNPVSGTDFWIQVNDKNVDKFLTKVNTTTYYDLIKHATNPIFDVDGGSFVRTKNLFLGDQSTRPLLLYNGTKGYNGDASVLQKFYGVDFTIKGEDKNAQNQLDPTPTARLVPDANDKGHFTPTQGGNVLKALADDFKYTREFLENTGLGSNDQARRLTIVTALQKAINSNTQVRAETFDFNLVLCPGYPETCDELLKLVGSVKDEVFVIGDTPSNKMPSEISNPSTGWAVSTERQASEHIAYYYPWCLASNLDGRDVVVAPSGTALKQYTFSDNNSFLWFAPAGLRRGVVSGLKDIGYVKGTLGQETTFTPIALNQGQRDALYVDASAGRINPIVSFPGEGIVIWGQKTSPARASAMDRVNVSRLIKYIKRQLRRNTLSFVFEPNDTLTRDNVKATVDNFLGDLIVKRGLYDFASVCDESNNTPNRIERNELYVDISLKPVKAAEFIYIPIRILSTGAQTT